MHSFDQNIDDALGHQEESWEDMKSVQFVISIVRASNWEEDGVFTVKLGLVEIAGVSQGMDEAWSYTLWSGESGNPGTRYETRSQAAFAAVLHYLKNQEEPLEEMGNIRLEKHPEYDEQQARLPKGCELWGNYGDGKWRVRNCVSHGIRLACDTPREAVDAFLASDRIKE